MKGRVAEREEENKGWREGERWTEIERDRDTHRGRCKLTYEFLGRRCDKKECGNSVPLGNWQSLFSGSSLYTFIKATLQT